MRFSQITSELTIPFTFALIIIFFIGFILGNRNGGWNRHMPYMWSLTVLALYTLVTPLFFFINGRKSIIGTDISQYYGAGFLFNILGLLSFITGYWLKGRNRNDNWYHKSKRELSNPIRKVSILFYVIYGIVLINLAIGGFNISNIFLGSEVIGQGVSGASYFFLNFSDSLIAVVIIAYYYDVPKRNFFIWLIASLFLFSLLGFRYRIILTLAGLLLVYLYKNKVSTGIIVSTLAVSIFFFYLILFSTLNRRELILKQYSSLEFDPSKFKYMDLFEQTRGALPDMAVYKLYDNPNRQTKYDYGSSIFIYIFIRMIPRAILPDKDKFYPPPQLKITHDAYDAWWGNKSGEATLSTAAFYIAGGWLGVVIGYFVWGFLLRRLSDHTVLMDRLSVMASVCIALATFQWITRGYFPQAVDHAVYLLIPVWLLRYFSKKKKEDEVNKPG